MLLESEKAYSKLQLLSTCPHAKGSERFGLRIVELLQFRIEGARLLRQICKQCWGLLPGSTRGAFAKESLEGLLFVVFGDARAEGAVDLVVCRPIFLYPKP